MEKVKAYTDIVQSKKLAEILPLESADMWFANGLIVAKTSKEPNDIKGVFPCWSLTALLDILPKRIEIVDNVYELSIYLYGIYYWNTINGNLCFKSKDKDNLVDACYEAIVFLHEQKLL